MTIRGKLLLSTVTALVLASVSGASSEPAKEINVMYDGGAWADALEKCVNEPFRQATGIKVNAENPGGYAKMEAQSKAGVIRTAVTDFSGAAMAQAVAADLLEPIDWAAIDPFEMFEEAKAPYGFGSGYYSVVMAFRPDVPAAKDWVDFFNVKDFPGKRTMPDYPDVVLPFAALAAGQSVEEMRADLDIDKAFAKLEEIKDHAIWWQAGPQPAQQMVDNEAQYGIAYGGRVVGNPDLRMTWNQGLIDISWFSVAKGTSEPEKEAVWAWLKLQSDPKVQACMVGLVPAYPGPSPELEKMLDPAVVAAFPTASENKKLMWQPNAEWWFKNNDEVQKRWVAFKLSL